MTLHVFDDLEQKSDEWHALRRGIVTASVIGKLITAGPPDAAMIPCPTCGADVGPCMSIARKEPTTLKNVHDARLKAALDLPPVLSAARNDTSYALTLELAAERITGESEFVFVNADMDRGNEVEPLARDLYSQHFGVRVDQVGFMTEDKWGVRIGYSPDGLVGDDGLIEVKGPRAKKHLKTIVEDQVPAEHMAQIQCGLLVSGRTWCDFITYYGGMRMYPIRVHADLKWQDAIVSAATLFEHNVQQIVSTYVDRTTGLPMTEPLPDYNTVELKLA